jgi:hypothetical protein
MTLLWLFVLLGLLGWALAQAVVPLGISWLKHAPGPLQARPRRILLVCALPWLIPFTAILSMAALAAAKSRGWVHDHCVFHAPGHPHFCFEHLPGMLLDQGQGHLLVAGTTLSIFALFLLRHWTGARRQSARIAALTALSRGKGLLRVLDDVRPMAFATGGRAPHIYLSRGLLDALTPREQRMVVAHEAAHLRQRDLTAGRLLETLLVLHPGPCADRLRELWRDATEVRADEQVARRFGRTETAELLLRLARSMQPAPVATAFGGGHLGLRIHALLQDAPSHRRRTPLFETMVASGLLALMIGAAAHHHTLETLLGMLVRL